MFINGDRINIISFACANNSTYVHVEMKIVLTMKKASLVVVLTQDESEEDEEEEEERDETLINGLDRIVLCLSLLFLFFSFFNCFFFFFTFNNNLVVSFLSDFDFD
jgi:hypothetical protein